MEQLYMNMRLRHCGATFFTNNGTLYILHDCVAPATWRVNATRSIRLSSPATTTIPTTMTTTSYVDDKDDASCFKCHDGMYRRTLLFDGKTNVIKAQESFFHHYHHYNYYQHGCSQRVPPLLANLVWCRTLSSPRRGGGMGGWLYTSWIVRCFECWWMDNWYVVWRDEAYDTNISFEKVVMHSITDSQPVISLKKDEDFHGETADTNNKTGRMNDEEMKSFRITSTNLLVCNGDVITRGAGGQGLDFSTKWRWRPGSVLLCVIAWLWGRHVGNGLHVCKSVLKTKSSSFAFLFFKHNLTIDQASGEYLSSTGNAKL